MQYNHLNELEVEDRLIEVLAEGRNQWVYRPDLKSEQDLWDNLRKKINKNNKAALDDIELTDVEFNRVKTEILSLTQTPFDAAKWLKGENGIARIYIEREDSSLGGVSLVLYSNLDISGGISSYEVVHQIATQNSSERNRRFDVTLLINGLPIIQIELKQVAAKDGIFQAFNQIKKYAEEGLFRNNIFSTLQLFVVSNETTTRYFANTLPKDMHRKFLFSWRKPNNEKVDNIYEFSKNVLNIPDAHRLIADYTIVSEDQDNKVLMVLHPYQIHAIEAIYKSASQHQSGYIWHATGSGKTLTSFVSTKLLAKKPGVDRTIMLLDRKDLDNQTTSEFTKFASEFNTGISSGKARSNTLIVGTDSSRALAKELLAGSNSNVVIVTTRQKLESALRYAQKEEIQKGTNRFKKLLGQHIVFIVDECHRAVSSEGMQSIKEFFPNSTWFGFTGTPIFEVNKKQAIGQLARTTPDQYGPVLHTYTIKNALEDGAVLGFQVEHENTIHPASLENYIYTQLREKYPEESVSNDEIIAMIGEMDDIEKESYLPSSIYEEDEHIEKVIRGILNPSNAYVKFNFENGKPQKSAILTTSSIHMAKKIYKAIKEFTSDPNWMTKQFKDQILSKGKILEDEGFPRIAITYSLEENTDDAVALQKELAEIIQDYNQNFGTSWDLSSVQRYNGDINNRLARKKAEFKQFGNHLDLVIVVDRLLTGFDAPTIQTLFVDRNLSYANLIQAFSRTNRTYPGKTKGMIVTYRKPATMEQNVVNATTLYSNNDDETNLIYPKYPETKHKYMQAGKVFEELMSQELYANINEHSKDEEKLLYVKSYQQLQNAYEAVVTYEEYNVDLPKSKKMQAYIQLLTDQQGHYENIKEGLIVDPVSNVDTSEIKFFSDSSVNMYDIDSAYINRLLGDYNAHNHSLRDEIEDAMNKLGKQENIKRVYRKILNDIDNGIISENEDVLQMKRLYFNEMKQEKIKSFANQWHVAEDPLHISSSQYRMGMKDIPSIREIHQSRDYDAYKQENPEAKELFYLPNLKKYWKELLNNDIVYIDDELKY